MAYQPEAHLELNLLGIEESDATKDSQSYKGQRVCTVDNKAWEHFPAIELPNHRQ